jgi:amidase
MNTIPPFDVLTATASELQARLIAGTLTSVTILCVYLDQIEKHNHAGAKLNAIITVAPRELALKRAAELDEERKNGRIRGPFHGLPIIVKVEYIWVVYVCVWLML